MPNPPVVAVDVWVVDAEAGPRADLLDALSPAERDRAAALPAAVARRFVVGRTVLRAALGERLGRAPQDVVLRATCAVCGAEHGPVTVDPRTPGPDLHVSVTRSGPVIAVALCAGYAVGIDAASRRAVAAAPLAEVALGPQERDHWSPRGRGARDLARAWVRKEAVLKARGMGLRTDPAQVQPVRTATAARGVDAVVGDDVAVADLRLGVGRVGAVAVVCAGLVAGDPASPARARGRLLVRRHDAAPWCAGRRG